MQKHAFKMKLNPGQAEEYQRRHDAIWRELVTLLCTPVNLDYLAVGYLVSEGLLHSRDNLKRTIVDDRRGVARVTTAGEPEPSPDYLGQRLITSGCGGGSAFYRAADVVQPIQFQRETFLPAADIFRAMRELQRFEAVLISKNALFQYALRLTSGQVAAADDGIVVRLPDIVDEPPGADLVAFDPDEIVSIVDDSVGTSSMFAARFRVCAARALLLPRRHPGRRR